jgi:hypothetical protein
MATLLLSSVGTLLGGPLGGSLGALIGNQLDRALFKPGGREGPRLKELQATSSSYGTPLARHFGKVRTAGSIIWSTDLVEAREKSGGGKGQPGVTAYSYSVSFAVALASRPIRSVGRVWADGNLLRGQGGDLKVAGTMRIYTGHGDQQPDPLIASAVGTQCPAFTGLAYCVFEDLQLADFGNRIPALTFEVIADEGGVSVEPLVNDVAALDASLTLENLAGFTDEGGAVAANLKTIGQVYPMTCDASGNRLTIRPSDAVPAVAPLLPEAAADPSGDSFAASSGVSRKQKADASRMADGLRYYDLSRDFQPGLQRADGRAKAGRSTVIEFPGVLDADTARLLANKAAERAKWASERIAWRLPELNPALTPGTVVRLPAKPGLWRIESWEWRESGVEVELERLPHTAGRSQAGDAGSSLEQTDALATPTLLQALELPWDGTGSGSQRQIVALASSAGNGWTGAALFSSHGGSLSPLGGTGRQRATIGHLAAPLSSGQPCLFDRTSACEIELASDDFALHDATVEALAAGANRAAIGAELVQFTTATRLSDTRWRIGGLLRGRGGSEAAALAGHAAGTHFALLDGTEIHLDSALMEGADGIAASGIADSGIVVAAIAATGRSTRPLSPVHPIAELQPDGSLNLRWTRRARAAWAWRDLVDVPLNEGAERYLVGIGDSDAPSLMWETTAPLLTIAAGTASQVPAGAPVWVRQIGSHDGSDPLLLHTFA